MQAVGTNHRKQRRRGYRPLAWRLPVAISLCLLPVIAYAHARLIKSDPTDRAALLKAPAEIQVWFNELLEDGFNTVALFPTQQLKAASRTNLIEGKPKLDGKDRNHVSAKVKPLPPGDYTVEWRVLSRDGHSAPGRFVFSVLPSK